MGIFSKINKTRLCSHTEAKDIGCYWLQGLVIEINGYLPLQVPKLLIFHEYLHFLQNTTTLFGMQSFIANWTTLFSIARVNKQALEIKLPIKKHSGYLGTPESESMKRLYKQTNGNVGLNCFDKNVSADVINIEFDETSKVLYQNVSNVYNFPVPSCTLKVIQRDKHLTPYKFGALAVCESLATLLEDALIGHSSRADEESLQTFPYHSFQYVTKYYERKSGKASIDRVTLARIADRSLMTIAPGFFAVRYLEEQIAHPKQTVGETVEIVNSKYLFQHDALVSVALKDLKTLSDASSISPVKKEMFQWFITHIETNLSARKDDPDKFIRPLISDDPWGECEKLLSVTPIPIIQLNGHGYYTLNLQNIYNKLEENIASNAAPFFRQLQFAINLHIESNPRLKCPAYEVCKLHFKDLDCLCKPWKHAERSPSCEAGSAFAFLGVKGKKVNKQS